MFALVRVDHWAQESRLGQERRRFASGQFWRIAPPNETSFAATDHLGVNDHIESLVPAMLRDAVALMWRQSLSIRRYLGTILFSFIIPTFLCLSPLLSGRVENQWMFIVAGIALCTMLLAPPALRIDFRRDLKRMLLLRSLPLRPIEAVLGQLTLPILITIAFQLTVLSVASVVLHPGIPQFVMWSGMLSALAVFTFAMENALFLAYPHHENAQGFAMVVRANVMFLGKATMIGLGIAALVAWVDLCKALVGDALVIPCCVGGSILGTWMIAGTAVAVTAWCWDRFDISADLPPE